MTDTSKPMNPDDRAEQQFADQVRVVLEQRCQQLDGATRSRLHTIRHHALAQRQARRRSPLLRPFGGLATAGVLGVTVLLLLPGVSPLQNLFHQAGADAGTPVEDIDLLTSSDSLELFEDYEFYQWLAENR